MMARWLLKSEPEDWSWAQQVARGSSGEAWTGVRNHQARSFLRQMQTDDLALFYHTGKERQIVGVVTVAGPARPDPTDPDWLCVDVVAQQALPVPVTLAKVKAAGGELATMALVKNPRLSVQPVTAAQWTAIMSLGGL